MTLLLRGGAAQRSATITATSRARIGIPAGGDERHTAGLTGAGPRGIGTSIRLLLNIRRPAAVARFVIPVVVGIPVERQSVGTLAHVTQERPEVSPPPLAHPDPSAPVVRVVGVVRILTSPDRRLPTPVRGTLGVVFCGGVARMTMRRMADGSQLARQTSARSAVSGTQWRGFHHAHRAAVTPTTPSCVFVRTRDAGHDFPSPESQADQLRGGNHGHYFSAGVA